MNVGSVRANNIKDPDSRDLIALGFVTGDGLLGAVVKAVCRLVDASALEYYDDAETCKAIACSAVEKARLDLYDALKAIEETTK